MRSLTIALLLATVNPTSPVAASPARPVAAISQVHSAPPTDDSSPTLRELSKLHSPGSVSSQPPGPSLLYPSYRWPLTRTLRNGFMLVNYTDLDASTATLDYSGGTHTYDGHTGIDILAYDFRLMDRGLPVLAAAPGTVTQISTPTPYDRNCDFNWPDFGNWVEVANGDGTYAYYIHMRANSVAVQVGDLVTTGQTLGLVGSSGHSTGPHLHFETGEYPGGNYVWREPFTGPSNPLPSLWQSQLPYAGGDPLWVPQLGVFTEAEVGGNVGNTAYCDIVRGLIAPAVYGANESHLCGWVTLQGRAGDSIRVEIRHPNGTVWSEFGFPLAEHTQFGWFWFYYFWNGNIAPADYGTWTLRAYSGPTLAASSNFQVGANTVYGARLSPREGRSFRINGTTQRDTLRRNPLTPALTYSLLGAPSFVTLQDSVVSVGPISNQPTRSRYFQVVASDAGGRRDTAWYHVVDLTKPIEAAVGVADRVPSGALRLSLASAHPAPGAIALRFELPRLTHARLAIVDAAGRRVSTLCDAELTGPQQVSWTGSDASGRHAPAGLYFAVLEAGGERRMLRVVKLD